METSTDENTGFMKSNGKSDDDGSGMEVPHIDISGSFSDTLRGAFKIKEREKHLLAVKKILRNQLKIIRSVNKKRDSGLSSVRYITEIVDSLIHIMWDRLEMEAEPQDKIVALLAVGGYGRRELCPKSDIDLLVVTSEKISVSEKSQAEQIVQNLWDYGFDVGISVRSIKQCADAWNNEPETATSFLSERFLAGNYKLYTKFLKILRKPMFPWKNNELVRYIFSDRVKRTQKFGGLIQLLEPNIKEGNGGLRDVQMITWVAWLKSGCRNLDDLVRKGLLSPHDLAEIQTAYGFLLQTRCCLHFIRDKKSDLLAFEFQTEVAHELGFSTLSQQRPVEIFLRNFYRHSKAVNRITESLLSYWGAGSKEGTVAVKFRPHPCFRERNGTLDLKQSTGNPFRDNIPMMIEYFDLANRYALAFGNHALLRLRQAIKMVDATSLLASRAILGLLDLCKRNNRVGRMLRTMHDVGLLELIIPEFSCVRFHTQHNIYHIYTTDEHIITVVRQLAYLGKLEDKQLASLQNALKEIKNIDVLIITCFFHDIGKVLPGDHCETGSRLVFNYMENAGFPQEDCKTASDLVLYHLTMNEVAQRRNLDDPNTIRQFIKKIKNSDFLRMLYVLTYCDISSVHPDAWSGWKATLLENLFIRTLEALKQSPYQSDAEGNKNEIVRIAALKNIPAEEVLSHLEKMPRAYFYSIPKPQVVKHLEMVRKINESTPEILLEKHDTHYKLVLVSPDHHRLLMVISGSLAMLKMSILSAMVYTSKDGLAIDEFNIEIPHESGFNIDEIRIKLRNLIKKYLPLAAKNPQCFEKEIKISPDDQFSSKSLHVPTGVEWSNTASENFSTIDISCRDSLGLMYLVTKVFADLCVNVHGAVLTTEADVAMDAFYVTDLNNRKIEDENKISSIKNRLEDSLIYHRGV